MLSSALWRDHTLSFEYLWPVEHQPRPGAAGMKLGYEFELRGWSWVPLLRSNRRERHPLLAGIYGDLIYHHGAGSRPVQLAPAAGLAAPRYTADREALARALFADPEGFIADLRGL